MHQRTILKVLLTVWLAAACVSKSDQATDLAVGPGNAVIWGNLEIDFHSPTAEKPLTIFLSMRNQETREIFRYQRFPRNPQTLAVLSVPEGNYLLEKIYVQDSKLGTISFYSENDNPNDVWKFVARRGYLSYMGHIRLRIQIDEERRLTRASILRDFKFDDDYKLLRRYYKASLYRGSENINAFDGKPIAYLGRSGYVSNPQPESRISFRRVDHGSIFVDAIINEQLRVKMVLDTGCTKTLLREELAKALGWTGDVHETISLTFADGSLKQLPTMKLQSLELGNAKVANLRPAICQNCSKNYTANLLCNDFLNHFNVQIDNENSIVILRYNE